MKKRIHVVAGVVRHKENNQILIAQRQDFQHQGGKWEFPGGKVEEGELPKQALIRELNEEIGIDVTKAAPLIQIQHDYPDKSILLDVWDVFEFTKEPVGKEGQPVKWVSQKNLTSFEFPEANRPILKAIALPERCLITPEPKHEKDFLLKLECQLNAGLRMVQFRAKALSRSDYMDLAKKVIHLVHQYDDAKIILNSPPLWMPEADGIHVSSSSLEQTPFRPIVAPEKWVSAACHSENELNAAARLKADFVFLSPVNETHSHPGQSGMGWEAFSNLTKRVNMPVYALGGLGLEHIETAKTHGAQGIAAISSLWNA